MNLFTTKLMILIFYRILEKRGHWVGIAKHVGHAMTFKILTNDTRCIIYLSNIWSALDPKDCNLHLDPLNADEDIKPIICCSCHSLPILQVMGRVH
jgi:hypothetical protein